MSGVKGHKVFVSFGNLNEMIGSANVNLGKNLCFVEVSKKVRHWGNWISILVCNLVESTIVNTKTKSFVGFWYEKNRETCSGSARANESP